MQYSRVNHHLSGYFAHIILGKTILGHHRAQAAFAGSRDNMLAAFAFGNFSEINTMAAVFTCLPLLRHQKNIR